MKTVKLITCDDAFQAHVIQGALKNEGIASVLHNENMSSVMRGYVRDVTGVDITRSHTSGVVVHAINPSTWEAKEGKSL